MINEKDIKVGLRFELSTALLKTEGREEKKVVGTYTIKDFGVRGGKVVVVYEAENGDDISIPLDVFLTDEHLIDNACLMASYPKDDWEEKVERYAWHGSPEHLRSLIDGIVIRDGAPMKSDPFTSITEKMCATYKAKNHDYGNSFHKLFDEFGMVYACGHLAEKLERIKSLMRDENKVKGESMKDSLQDLANYAVLTLIELNEKDGTT